MVLTLHGQADDVRNPIYDRRGLIAGELEMKRPERVLAVSVKLEGRVTMSVAGVGAKMMRTMEHQAVLWAKEEGSQRRCPGTLLFSLRLPSKFVEDDETWKLPPSFEPDFINVNTMFVRSTYILSISLRKLVNYRLVSWTKSKMYNVLVEHRPQNRPTRPVPLFDSICSSVKSLPDDWVQLVSRMEVTPGSRLRPVQCQFLVPSNPTYCLSDAIPFHIQLSSSLGTIRELFPPSSQFLQPRQTQDKKQKAMRRGVAMRVYIAREIMVAIRGKKVYRTVAIGSGTVKAIPPTDLGRISVPPEDVCLEWEGEVKCWDQVTCGGFNVGCLNVKDYIVLALTPPLSKTYPELVELQIAHPVKFVTEPWLENGTMHPRDY
ncbi:hypothetical protein AN958_11428 [Leucoagaricus sp. SymC.cos]|nr:hypothetical protein AN958_11428 [Leucoagaricus sp. SymC.cos]